MIEQRPTWMAPLLFVLGLGCTLCAHWLPLHVSYRLSLMGVGMVGVIMAASPAWRWLSAWGRRSPARGRWLHAAACGITGLGASSLLVSLATGWLWPMLAADGGTPLFTETQAMVTVTSGLLAALCAPVSWRMLARGHRAPDEAESDPAWLSARPWQLLVLLGCSLTYLGLQRGLDEAVRQQLLSHMLGRPLLLASGLVAGICVFGCVLLLARWRLQGLSRYAAVQRPS